MARFGEAIWEMLPGLVAAVAVVAWVVIQVGCGIRLSGLWLIPGVVLLVCLVYLGGIVFRAAQYFLTPSEERWWTLRVFETAGGRTAGWYVMATWRRVAVLTDVRFEEMFWDSYRIEPLTEDPEEKRRILSDRDWWASGQLVFLNRELGVAAYAPFPSLSVFTESGRVAMRGLYVSWRQPTSWEWVVLWVRARFHNRRDEGTP